MNNKGPVIIIEDDEDDKELYDQAFRELARENEIVFFDNGVSAFTYLNENDISPFLIISDINTPLIGGVELRDKLHTHHESRLSCTPFIFFTTAANRDLLRQSYLTCIQGFFLKPATYKELRETLHYIMGYWMRCAEFSE